MRQEEEPRELVNIYICERERGRKRKRKREREREKNPVV
jgi:hypothetical protein